MFGIKLVLFLYWPISIWAFSRWGFPSIVAQSFLAMTTFLGSFVVGIYFWQLALAWDMFVLSAIVMPVVIISEATWSFVRALWK